MQAWATDQKIEGTMVTFMADPAAELTKALGMEMTHSGPPSVGIIGRCKRFAIHADDEQIKTVKISEAEGDPAGDDDPSATLAEGMLEAITAEKQRFSVAVDLLKNVTLTTYEIIENSPKLFSQAGYDVPFRCSKNKSFLV